jgi:hypothetical protein
MRKGNVMLVLLAGCLGACDEEPSKTVTDGPRTIADKGPADGDSGPPGDNGAPEDIAEDQVPLTDTLPPQAEALFVSLQGDDKNPGTLAQPFRSPERARQAIRDLKAKGGLPAGGVVVYIRGGLYPRSTTFLLEAQDSGEPSRPVIYRSFPGEQARFAGAVAFKAGSLSPIKSTSKHYAGLEASARSEVVEVELKSLGISDYGQLEPRGFGVTEPHSAMELFVDGAPMTLARWPDADADDPAQTPQDATVALYGDPGPDVSGTFKQSGTQDGVNAYSRVGLVGGKQYHLYRHTWTYQGTQHRAWFVTTTASGYPKAGDPFWHRYNTDWGPMTGAQGATGTILFRGPEAVSHGFVSIVKAVSDTSFTYAGKRPERWTSNEIWMHGFWMHAWADRHTRVASIDTATKTVTLTEKPGYGIVTGQPYYAENLPEEITQPGEWYVDRVGGTLLLWPPKPLGASSELLLSMLEEPLFQLKGASHVELHDLTLEASRGELLRIEGGDHNRAVLCTLRNGGVTGAVISGSQNGLERCLVHHTGDGGVRLSGGVRASLTKGENYVEDSTLHHFGRWSWTYKNGVNLSGCGHRVAHNLFHSAPHTAILFSGNEHLIEYNDIHHVCQFSSDAGAIYTGRDWGYRGNEVRYNFIHELSTHVEGYGVQGVYLDDCVSGIHVFGNVLYKIETAGIQHGGGRDVVMENNIIARCGRGLSTDSRGIQRVNNVPGDSWNLLERLAKEGIQYQQDPWAKAYPLLAKIPNSWATLSAPGSTWLYPEGTVFSRNLGFKNTTWIVENNSGGTGTLNKFKEQKDNVEDQDPLFVDEGKLDLDLQPGSPALKIPGWKPIPFDNIGPR